MGTEITPPQEELNAQVQMLQAVLSDMDKTIRNMEPEDLSLVEAMSCRKTLAEPSLSMIRERLDTLIGEAMGAGQVTVPGVGVLKRSRPTKRTDWQHEDLLRIVLDTRRVNVHTGEVESDVDKIKHVYPLAGYQARLQALRERGINPDDFCVVEKLKGWKIQSV